jgi:hypothetical protein
MRDATVRFVLSKKNRGFEMGRVRVGIAVGRSASSARPKSRSLTKQSYPGAMFFGFPLEFPPEP